MKTAIPKFLAIVATGLLSGAFMYGLLNLVPAFYEVPIKVHLTFRTQLMNHNSVTMQTLMAISIITPVWYAMASMGIKRVMMFSFLSASMALTSLLVTRFGNVPINIMMRTWTDEHLPIDWMYQLQQWDFYNMIRCITGMLSFVSIIIATHLNETIYRKN